MPGYSAGMIHGNQWAQAHWYNRPEPMANFFVDTGLWIAMPKSISQLFSGFTIQLKPETRLE
jgi:hypothetical protein